MISVTGVRTLGPIRGGFKTPDADGSVYIELVSRSNEVRVWRMRSRCRECGSEWDWFKYTGLRGKVRIFHRCAQCAANEHNREQAQRHSLLSAVGGGPIQ